MGEMDETTRKSMEAAMTNAGYPRTSGDVPTEDKAAERPERMANQERDVSEQPQAPRTSEDDDESDQGETDWDAYTVEELREELRTREMPTSGTKPELIERLRGA